MSSENFWTSVVSIIGLLLLLSFISANMYANIKLKHSQASYYQRSTIDIHHHD